MTINASDGTDLGQSLKESNLIPLWERYKNLASNEPQPIDGAMHWPWESVEPLIVRSQREVPMGHIERRALIFANPEFGGRPITTGTMNGAFQTILPGEAAEAHRHTAAAIRFVIESDGAVTSVDGQGCRMEPGDLVLTPAWTWHGHRNDTSSRAIWFDGLDVPFVRFNADAFFYEPGQSIAPPNATEHSPEQASWGDSGMIGTEHIADRSYSPRFHYSWALAQHAIGKLRPAHDQSRLMRYANPLTGGSVMPTIDCYLLQLERGVETQPVRSTFSSICVVVEGEGASNIGDRKITWKKNDVFSVPHWRWASHKALTKSYIFQMTDRELYARLDLLRQEKG